MFESGRALRAYDHDQPDAEVAMFDVDEFVVECQEACAQGEPILAIKDIVDRVVTEPRSVAKALSAEPGVEILHRSAALTVLNVVIPSGSQPVLPHDHRMWALVGVYGGQEDNHFFRRAERGLSESGGRSLMVSDSLAMGDDTIHSIGNPLAHSALAAIHVYGGDLLGAERSMWIEPGYEEQPYDAARVVGQGGFRDPRQ
ncbi:MAG: hypothetical protein NVS3B21_32370 [Acidimicrobiales bacterium]